MYGNTNAASFTYVKLDPKKLDSLPDNARDVSEIGHYGTGDLELSIRTENELNIANHLLKWLIKSWWVNSTIR